MPSLLLTCSSKHHKARIQTGPVPSIPLHSANQFGRHHTNSHTFSDLVQFSEVIGFLYLDKYTIMMQGLPQAQIILATDVDIKMVLLFKLA